MTTVRYGEVGAASIPTRQSPAVLIEYAIVGQSGDQWNTIMTVNGERIRTMTAYSYFGNSDPPKGFKVALLGEDRSEFLAFQDRSRNWIVFGDYIYEQCN